MKHDRITQLRIRNLRCIENLTLDLRGLTVLIGDNGTGKSSILEAIELVRLAAKPIDYLADVIVGRHGGLDSLLRRGSRQLSLGVTIEGNGPKIEYGFVISEAGSSPIVESESIDVFAKSGAEEPLHALIRDGTRTSVFDVEQRRLIPGSTQVPGNEPASIPVHSSRLALPWLGVQSQPAVQRVIGALERMEFHVPFETRPLWQQRELQTRIGPRWPSEVEPTDSLARFALNLPNAFQALRNQGNPTWSRVVERARLGLGDDVRDFRISPAGRGKVELEIVLGSSPDRPLPVENISEGQLSYLAFIAVCDLHSERSLVAFDEPELHLHPNLLTRVTWMLEELGSETPVLLSTHSDRMLDALLDPAKKVVLCALDERGAAQLHRPDADRLAAWLKDFRGFGSLRREGFDSSVFRDVH